MKRVTKPFEEEENEDFEEEYDGYAPEDYADNHRFLYDEDDYESSDSDYEGDD
ncbi:hypothetical protein [Helicobacter sp.]|uniref:hypothetical protein n=1 Tax=Helicobacter sp. TaxID=218 RepID=UPI0025C41E77|nr:hypothetical protein [Helicobacter sp.]MCI5968097.1 hypothetical protein [Helicobacter sp.]MDY2584105.1 hypothetical protein [Helicobacter sp.]